MADQTGVSVVEGFRGMDASRRFGLLAGAAAAVVVIWLLVSWTMRPPYVVLYRALDLDDAGAVTQELTANGIPFEYADGGTEIRVPARHAATARVVVAQKGIAVTGGRPGMEIFDEQAPWGQTDFTLRVTLRRALEGELARAIGAMRGIDRAQVLLVLPDETRLRRLREPAEAAVLVTPQRGAPLDQGVVRAITYLVSNSVPYLNSEQVAVLDDAGRILSTPQEEGSIAGLSSRQLEVRREVERHVGTKAEAILASLLPSGEFRVQVSADLDFTRTERQTNAVDPNQQALSLEETQEQTGPDGTPITSQRTEFQNSRSLETTVGSTGDVTRMTVAVLVNERAALLGAGADAARSAQELARIESLVRDAVGIDATRGDRLTVLAIPFEDPLATAVAPAAAAAGFPIMETIERFIRPVVALVGIIATLVLVQRILRPQMAALAPRPEPAALAAPPTAGPEQLSQPSSPPTQIDASSQLRDEVMHDMNVSPESAARVVRAWLSESA